MAGTVRDLAKAEAAIAKEHGLGTGAVDAGLLFEAGTKLWGIGEAALQEYAAEYAALPTLAEASEQLAATLAAEQRATTIDALAGYRVDGTGKLREVKLDDTGRITFGTKAVAVSTQAFGQIIGYYPHDRSLSKGGRTRRAVKAIEQWPAGKPLPPAASNVNGWIGDLRDRKDQAKKYKRRTRTHRGQRELFGVFSGSETRGYTAFDGDRLLAEAAKHQPNLRVALQYDADSTVTRARCIAQAPIDIPAFVGVGRVHQIGFDLRTADDGSAILSCTPFLIRVRCKNASLVQTNGKRQAFKHVGSFEKLCESLETVIQQASAAIEPMRALWAQAAGAYYLDGESGAALSPVEAITRMVFNGYLPTGGLDEPEAVTQYVNAWRAEDSPASAQGVIMAVQRAAHEGQWRTRWAEDDVEETASAMLYQPVYQLWTPEAEEVAEA